MIDVVEAAELVGVRVVEVDRVLNPLAVFVLEAVVVFVEKDEPVLDLETVEVDVSSEEGLDDLVGTAL